MIWRGATLFPYYDLGEGYGKFPTKMTLNIGEGQPFFSWKGNENMLLDALKIPVFYDIFPW